ncbi:putative Ig domain-containing protein [Spirosoma spitsbergense]|uniref:putative Ig domain-containing protein n=1 Tax=Spirosoma spitsbergense TaxID=431554 RepID=UPI00036A0F38|nr:putative Ig domain-containing protein [Spirosoma spitsbergense]
MNKRNLCRTATVLCGLLALIIYTRPETGIGHWPTDKLMGASLGLLSAIFGTQWIEYQKRQDTASSQPGTPGWVRRLLFSGLLLLTMTGASAQTTWTARPQTGDKQLSDVAYGAGTYVAVGGDDGLIRISTDGITWTNQVAGTNSANGLSAIIYATGKFVAVGNNGRTLTSTDGLTWTTQVSGTSTVLQGITYGGGQFVAVGFGGVILTSPDGITWTARTADQAGNVTLQFQDVTYGGGQFAVVGSQGVIQTSPNGVTWTTRASGTTAGLYGITAGGNGNFVAVGTNSTLVTSPDGVTWTPQIVAGPSTFLTSVAYNSTTGQFVAVATTGTRLLTSLDGLTWTAHPSGTYAQLKAVRYLNGQYITVGDYGTIRSSTDGITWKPLTIVSGINFKGAAYGNGHYVAVGSYLKDPANPPATANVAVTSDDGINYEFGITHPVNGAGDSFNDVAFGNGLFAAVGGEALVKTSVDGKSWHMRYSNLGQSLNGIAYGGGRFVAIGTNGLVVRSTDGIAWTVSSSGPTVSYYGITYANGQFVAVGFNGAIGTSPDGAVWTSRTSGTATVLTSVAYGNGVYTAVGVSGLITRSVDGITWAAASSLPAIVYDITFGNGQFVAVVQGSAIFTSPDGLVWTSRVSNVSSGLYGVTHGNGLFVAVGVDATFTTSPDDGAVPPANQPPVAPVIANQSGTVGQAFSQTLPPFTDPEGLILTYSVAGLPAGLNFTAPSTVSGTPTTQDVSTVTVTATDPGNLSTNATYTITINPAGGPPPVDPGTFAITGVTLISCNLISPTQRQLVFSPQYAGLNGQPISFSVLNEMLPTLNAGPYTLSMYIDNPSITLKATQNGTAGEASFVYGWLAACSGNNPPPGNQPPVAPVIPDASVTVGQVYSQTIPPFTDPEGLPLTYSIMGLPPGMLVIGGGNISGPPTTAGIYMITVTATDPGGLSASATYTLTINPAGSNPGAFAITGVTLVSCQAISATQRQLVFTPQYTGTTGQPISFSVANEMLPTTNPGPYTLNIYTDNPTITLKAVQSGTVGEASFSYNWSSACSGSMGARIGTSTSVERLLDVRLLGNPVENGALSVEVRGAGGQPVQLCLTDLRGQVVGSYQVSQADSVEQHTFEIGHQSAGLYLLRVSTPIQMRTVKVLKR